MPTYEFRCPKGHEFEKFYRSMSGAPLEAPCPVCGKIAERQMSAGAGLVFKGSGFYITDYRSDSYREAAKKEAPAAPATADKPAAGKDGKATATPAKGEPKPKKQAAE